MALTVEQAQKELEKVNKELESYGPLLERRKMLEQFLALAVQLSNNGSSPAEVSTRKPRNRSHSTMDIAFRVLEKSGPLHLKDLVKRMHNEGWLGSKNDKNAEKAVYIGMYRQTDQFVRIGRNIWSVKRNEAKSAS